MPNFTKLTTLDIRLGEPLPFSVYDKSGTLLLKAGCSIKLERHLDLLLQNGLFANCDEMAPRPEAVSQKQEEKANTFLILDTAKIRLHRLFQLFKMGNHEADFLSEIESIAITIQEACSRDPDSALANLHLDYDSSYCVVHHLQAAILCELIANKIGIKEESRLILISAALTHDIGILDIQERLDRQKEALSDAQRQEINAHPERSAEILINLGVSAPVWLDAVKHHHERLDGTGYPDHLAGDALTMPARILAIADIYSAMIRERPYRKAVMSKDVMRSMLVEQGKQVDMRLIQMMIKEIGVYSPGAIVQLCNKEIAVVKRRQEDSASPIVYSFIRDTGMPMLTPINRDTTNDAFKVESILPFSRYSGSIAILRGIWTNTSN